MTSFDVFLDEFVERVAARAADLVIERLRGAGVLDGPRQGDDERLLSVREAARRLGLRPSTVYKMAGRGSIPSVKLGGRRLFRVADLDRLVSESRLSSERIDELARAALLDRRPRSTGRGRTR
jgi:excisionase family DNA binding protein